MLQILIWMGCVLFLLIGLQFFGSALSAPDESIAKTTSSIGAFISTASAVLFFFLVGNQADRANSYLGASNNINGAYQGSLSISERAEEGLTPEQRAYFDRLDK